MLYLNPHPAVKVKNFLKQWETVGLTDINKHENVKVLNITSHKFETSHCTSSKEELKQVGRLRSSTFD